MAQSAPGKHWRKGISLVEVMRMFPDDSAAEAWFAERRWGGEPHCPKCGSLRVATGQKHPTMPYRCRDCRKIFSVRTGTVMAESKLGYQVWAIAIYLMTTGIKGVSSMKLHRDLNITQRTAWHLAHRIRQTWNAQNTEGLLSGIVEVDETYVGGKVKNMSNKKRREFRGRGRGPVGKEIVIGARERETGKVVVRHIPSNDRKSLHKFILENTQEGTQIMTDEARAYAGLEKRGREHQAVNHSVKKFVDGMAHTNGIESFWSILKRGFDGTFHKMSPKHLDRYIEEFAGRYNDRNSDTLAQMEIMACAMVGKRLQYKELIADNGMSNGAQGAAA